MEAAAVGHLDHRRVRISVRVRRARVGRIDADVVARKTFDQPALRCDRPFFEVRGQPVRIHENEIREIRLAACVAGVGDADQAGDHSRER